MNREEFPGELDALRALRHGIEHAATGLPISDPIVGALIQFYELLPDYYEMHVNPETSTADETPDADAEQALADGLGEWLIEMSGHPERTVLAGRQEAYRMAAEAAALATPQPARPE